MRYLTFLFVLMFIFLNVFMVSIPQTLYSEDDTVDCTFCWQPVTRGTNHYDECPVIQAEKQEQARKDQEQDVAISNERAERERFEDKYEAENDNDSIADLAEDIVDASGKLSKEQNIAKRVVKWIGNQLTPSVKCQGCQNYVSDDKKHWGTGGCAIGHKHWTCVESERILHAGCYWVDEPETNPDAMYQNTKYSVTCMHGCGTTRWTNSLEESRRWRSDPYCFMYGSGY